MSADHTEQSAADWLAREDRGLAADEQAAMQAWLAESTLNRVAYLRLKDAWNRAGLPPRLAPAGGGAGGYGGRVGRGLLHAGPAIAGADLCDRARRDAPGATGRWFAHAAQHRHQAARRSHRN